MVKRACNNMLEIFYSERLSHDLFAMVKACESAEWDADIGTRVSASCPYTDLKSFEGLEDA
jgi:hypothetical protein